MNCRQCGGNIRSTDKFCPNCGAANPEYVEVKDEYKDPFSATSESFYERKNENLDPFGNPMDAQPRANDPFRGNSSNYRMNEEGRYIHKEYNNQVDNPTCGLGLLSFLFPIVGFILYFVFKSSNKPQSAKHAAKWAWTSIIISVVMFFITFIISFIIGFEYY